MAKLLPAIALRLLRQQSFLWPESFRYALHPLQFMPVRCLACAALIQILSCRPADHVSFIASCLQAKRAAKELPAGGESAPIVSIISAEDVEADYYWIQPPPGRGTLTSTLAGTPPAV